MLVTCFSTARSVTTSCSAIAWFERPSAISVEHLAVALRERDEPVVAATATQHLDDDLRVERRAALADAAHRVREALDVPHPVLEQVAGPFGAVADEVERIALVQVLRQDHHPGFRQAAADLDCRAKAVVGFGRRHPDVHHRHVGLVRGHLSHQVLGIACLRDDLEARVPEHAHDPLPHEYRVFADDYTHRILASRVLARALVTAEAPRSLRPITRSSARNLGRRSLTGNARIQRRRGSR